MSLLSILAIVREFQRKVFLTLAHPLVIQAYHFGAGQAGDVFLFQCKARISFGDAAIYFKRNIRGNGNPYAQSIVP